MREFDALNGYPDPAQPRVVGPDIRTIQQRIVASYRDKEYYDGDRRNGYGGFKYDGRWFNVAKNMATEYGLNNKSSVLQVGCEKGFLLHDFQELFPGIKVRGTDVSRYALEHAMDGVKSYLTHAPFTKLPFEDKEFDFVIGIGAIYCLNLADAIVALKEIQRVSRGKSFVTLASYETPEEFWMFRYWTILGTTVLKPDEWREVMQHAGYTGDYKFTNSRTLKLILDQKS